MLNFKLNFKYTLYNADGGLIKFTKYDIRLFLLTILFSKRV